MTSTNNIPIWCDLKSMNEIKKWKKVEGKILNLEWLFVEMQLIESL